jgi:tetratricopeptide (TPR) repeat protein
MAFSNDGYDAGTPTSTPETRLPTGLIKRAPPLFNRGIAASALLLVAAVMGSVAQDSRASASPPAVQQLETNSQETLRAIMRIENQLRSNQIATEQNSKEARESAARNAELLLKGLQTIEEAFLTQQRAFSERNLLELQAMQGFNRTILIAGGTFATLASLTILVVVYFQWRASRAWAQISLAWSGRSRLAPGPNVAALESSHAQEFRAGEIAESNSPLTRAVGQLETQVQKLEQSTLWPQQAHNPGRSPAEDGAAAQPPTNGDSNSNHTRANGQASVAALLGKGRAHLKANECEAALKCFDEVLSLDPSHCEALVKKGATLEQLSKFEEAFDCYDQAVAADDSMTIAYLHKGGLCSRLERFKEALECYEQALRTHTERSDSN